MSKTRCDEAVELSIHLAMDPKQNDQMVRGIVSLAEGSGNHLRVLVLTQKPEEVMAAGSLLPDWMI
jgi:large subunit ribosomal protein L1